VDDHIFVQQKKKEQNKNTCTLPSCYFVNHLLTERTE